MAAERRKSSISFCWQIVIRGLSRLSIISRIVIPRTYLPNLLHFDLDIDTRGKIEAHEGVNGFWRWIRYVNQTFVRPHLILLTRILMDERGFVHGVPVFLGRKRNRTLYVRAASQGGINNRTRGLIDNLVIKRTNTDADPLMQFFLFVFLIRRCCHGVMSKTAA